MVAKNKIRKYLGELKQIAAKNHGVLRGDDIVAFAANKKTVLHGWFEWNDGAAAHQFRLEQARALVRVSVEMLPRASIDYRAFVSLVADRSQAGGGYRITSEVLSRADMRAAFVAEALAELDRCQEKYAVIKELARVFSVYRKIRKTLTKPTARKRKVA